MQALFWLTIAYRVGDEAERLDLQDSSQHDWGWIRSDRTAPSSSPVRPEPASLLLPSG
jgi:hypothetical protein